MWRHVLVIENIPRGDGEPSKPPKKDAEFGWNLDVPKGALLLFFEPRA